MEERFEEVHASPFFVKLVCLLDTKSWPKTDLGTFGDDAINDVVTVFRELLLQNYCKVDNILSEWTMFPMIANNLNAKYLEIWKRVFTNATILNECRNCLDVFECLLI